MSSENYRIYPIVFVAFLKIAISFTMELAIPLYYLEINFDPSIIGIISSATSMIYLFSPAILSRFVLKIGIKKSLLISVTGSLSVLTIFQFSLDPLLVYLLLICEGILAGLFWPVLITNISNLTGSQGYCEDDSSRDKLTNSYNISWNLGAVFSYFSGTILLFFIDDIVILLRLVLIYAVFLLLFTILFEEPKLKMEKNVQYPIPTELENSCKQEKLYFPKFLPFYLICFYGFLIGALLLTYPIKAEELNLLLFTIYLFNLFRMTAQTISISQSTKLNINRFKGLILVALIILSVTFIMFGITTNLIMFGILFVLFGLFGSTLYAFSFKLVIYLNIRDSTSKYSGYFETFSGIGFFLAPVIIGFIAEINNNISFYVLAILSLLSMLVYGLIIKRIKTQKSHV